MNRETRPGDVVRSSAGVYRMYYKDQHSKTEMRCMSLDLCDAYSDNMGNSEIDLHGETFVFNMKELIASACADKR